MNPGPVHTPTPPRPPRRRAQHPAWPLLPLALLAGLLALLVGPSGFGLPDWHTATGRAILGLRAGRIATGFFVGAGLAAAGTVLQALLRNPLADPYVLGVSGGSGLAAAATIALGWTAAGPLALPAAAFAGGLAALAVVYALSARGRSAPSLYALLLSGVIVGAMCSSLLMLLIALAPVEGMHGILWWMLGNLQMTPPGLLRAAALLVGAGLAGVTLLGRELNALTLGRDAAHHLGVRTGLAVSLCLALATLMAAACVAMAGLIGFVGLIVPHAARAWVGPDHRRLPLVAALMGGVFLLLCDAAARTLLAPREIPVGVITALVGGPFFLLILRRRQSGSWVE